MSLDLLWDFSYHNYFLNRDVLSSNQDSAQSTSIQWLNMVGMLYLNHNWGACKHCYVAELQRAGVRIWAWPWIIHGGSRLLQYRPVVYEFGLKSNIRTTSKDNFQSTLVKSAAAQVNRPHNTSLTSELSGVDKRAGVICRTNVFTWYLT